MTNLLPTATEIHTGISYQFEILPEYPCGDRLVRLFHPDFVWANYVSLESFNTYFKVEAA